MAGVRAELMRGDERPLYLAWLLGLDGGELDDDDEEPPVPPGLGKLPASLASMVEFLRIDEHLVAAAAEGSAAEQPKPEGMAKWIARIPQKEKDALLLRVAQGEHAHVAAALVRRFRKEMLQEGNAPAPQRRTVGELLGRADELREAELRRQARAAAEARRKRAAAAAAAKAKRFDALAARKPAAWRDVRQLVDSKKPKSYDEAVKILGDLRDLAERENDEILTDAYGDDEQLWALRQAFKDIVALPVDAFVIGEPVEVLEVDYDGNTRRGLTARCRRADGAEHVVAASEVVFSEGSDGARHVAAYRKWLGLEPAAVAPAASPRRPKRHKAAGDDLDLSRPIELVVLAPR